MSFSIIEQPRAKVRYLRMLTRRESEQNGSIAPPPNFIHGRYDPARKSVVRLKNRR